MLKYLQLADIICKVTRLRLGVFVYVWVEIMSTDVHEHFT